jgi:fibronectin-binding autotransporter adhesin
MKKAVIIPISLKPEKNKEAQMQRIRTNGKSFWLLALLVFRLATACQPARATQYNFSNGGANTNWNNSLHWSPFGIPGNNDFANVANTDGVVRTIAYDYAGAAVSLSELVVDGTAGGSDTLTMAANNLTAATEYIGYSGVGGNNGVGTVNQSGGVNTILSTGNGFFLGLNPTDQGFYTLSGNGSIAVTNAEVVGNQGTGTFVQNGGTNTVNASNIFYIAELPTSRGTYDLNNGSLSVSGVEYIADQGIGNFTQQGGANNVLGGNALYVGFSGASANGTYTLDGGSLNASGNEYVGYGGTGTFNQNAGQNIFASGETLYLGFNAGVTGNYTLGGNATLSTSGGVEVIGASGTGIFTQNGGSNYLNGSNVIYLGQSAGSSGTYSLSAGSLTSIAGEFIGVSGTGTLMQSGGTNSTAYIIVADNAGSSGTYTLSGGSCVVSGGTGVIVGGLSGPGGQGVLTVSGGVLNITTAGLTAWNTTGTSINLNGGTIDTTALNLNGSPSLFNWTSGTLNIVNNVAFDPSTGAATTSAAFGPALNLGSNQTLVVTGNETIGGAASFALGVNTRGTNTVTGTLALSPLGSLVNNGGTINVGGLNFAGVASNFQWNSGTLNITSSVVFDSAAAASSTSAAFGSALSLASGQTLQITGNETLGGAGAFSLTVNSGASHTVTGNITVNPTGMLFLQGGSLSYSSLTQSGGAIIGTLSNPLGSTFNFNSGNFIAQFINSGVANINGNFAPGTGLANNATLNASGTVSAPNFSNTGTINISSLQLGLATILSNDGIVNLNNGTIGGPGQLTNNSDGTISGPGSITTAFVNNGSLVVSSGTTNVPAFTNNGVIEMAGAGAQLDGATITNTATIEGFGKIGDPVTNNGTIQPINGTLIFSGNLSNSASGLITTATGTKVLAAGGLATNAGILNLAGGTFDNGGQTMSNTGQISGFGILNTGGLTNNGAMTLTGGTAIVNGPVINAPSKTINVKYQPAIFTGPVTNNGTIKTTNTTVTFTGNYTGNAYISDPSTNIFQANVTVVPGGMMTGASGDQYFMSGGTFTNQGTYTNTGLIQSSDPTSNSGAFTQGGTQTWSPGTVFTNTAGVATFLSDAGSATAYNLSLNVTGGSVVLASPQHWDGLVISGTGQVNVANNHLIIAYGSTDPIASIKQYLATGYANGKWNGIGINSSSAAANSSYTLGYADGADGVVAGLPSGEIEIKYTLYGDINLDGVVNGTDFSLLASHFGQSTTKGPEAGDLNYDGVVNGSDFGLLAGNFGKSATGESITLPASQWAALDAFAAAHGLLADVPEPSTLAGTILGGVLVLRRRRLAWPYRSCLGD